jgi:hypothetical protein
VEEHAAEGVRPAQRHDEGTGPRPVDEEGGLAHGALVRLQMVAGDLEEGVPSVAPERTSSCLVVSLVEVDGIVSPSLCVARSGKRSAPPTARRDRPCDCAAAATRSC